MSVTSIDKFSKLHLAKDKNLFVITTDPKVSVNPYISVVYEKYSASATIKKVIFLR